VWDETRDATRWPGGAPVIAHPPCAQWARLRKFARENQETKAHALYALAQVRRWTGVLEHPIGSTLWSAAKLPRPGELDDHGGFTLVVDQFWFGHPAQKRTWLYVCGIAPADVPPIPFKLGYPTHFIKPSRARRGSAPTTGRRFREGTPPDFAQWLIELARRGYSINTKN